MKKTEYIIWSDGVLTSMGVKRKDNGDGTYNVESPVNIVFSTEQIQNEDGSFRSVMRFDMTPYLFGVCLKEDDAKNVWTCRPTHVLVDGQPADDIVKAYHHTIEVTSRRPNADKKD